ncbi:MAG: hypothetical protein FRX49_10797 [Trebouxia sp. A1-2]|nr:MAG: hypothetical protein FRX49_10797 [Trebouxia sp. A1-2]
MFSEIGNIKQMLVAAAGVAGGGQTVLMSVKMVSRSPFLLSFVHRFRQQDFKAFAAFPDVEVQGMVGIRHPPSGSTAKWVNTDRRTTSELLQGGASSDELQHCARQPTKGGWAWAYIIGHVSPVKATCPWTCKPSGFSCSVQQRGVGML